MSNRGRTDRSWIPGNSEETGGLWVNNQKKEGMCLLPTMITGQVAPRARSHQGPCPAMGDGRASRSTSRPLSPTHTAELHSEVLT